MRRLTLLFFLGLAMLLAGSMSCTSDPDGRLRKAQVEKEMLEGKRLHDGALELQTIGDIESVPALLVVLKENPPFSNGTMVCTAAHALAALRTITGENPGNRYEDWQKWYENRAKPPT